MKHSDDADMPEARACIVAAPSHVLIDADYAAIELRVLAQITGDECLQQIFRDGGDPHRTMAAMVAGKPEAEVTKAERDRAKPVNFGFPFRLGPVRAELRKPTAKYVMAASCSAPHLRARDGLTPRRRRRSQRPRSRFASWPTPTA